MAYFQEIVFSSCRSMMFIIFCITFIGYLLGDIKVKGVELGTAGVFLSALFFGHFAYSDASLLRQMGIITVSSGFMQHSMSLIQEMGLLCFVTSVGFIAGPNFFHNLKKNVKSYAFLGLIIIGSGALTCAAVILLTSVDSAMGVGILSGALTTTPGFAAAQDIVRSNEFLLNEVTVGHAIGYPFGVVGVVLFVQIVPKLVKANILEEQKKINAVSGQPLEFKPDHQEEGNAQKKLIDIDPIGLGPLSLAVVLGILLGKVRLPLPLGTHFSLGNTGGALIVGLILGHFGRIGRINMRISTGFLKAFREFGLVMFLIGAGVPGGSGFVDIVREYGLILFLYGALMTTVPLLVGYFIAKHVVKLCLLNNLGAITGGMTSTPALGALINVAKTDDVAASYAATYPVALVLVVLASQFLMTFL